MLYNDLINGHLINKYTYSIDHNINERTFERDISEIRNYLSEIFSPYEVLYDKKNDVYFLSGNRPMFIDKMDAVILSKVLLDSKTLRRDEVRGLLEKIMITVNPYEVNQVISFIKKDIDLYESRTKNSILKILNDLYMIIDNCNDVEILCNDGKKITVSPIRILIKDSKFILLANSEEKQDTQVMINIDEISNFKILNTFYAKNIQQHYWAKIGEKGHGN